MGVATAPRNPPKPKAIDMLAPNDAPDDSPRTDGEAMGLRNMACMAKGVNPALATIIFIPLVTLLLIVNLRRISKEREDEIQNKKVKMKG